VIKIEMVTEKVRVEQAHSHNAGSNDEKEARRFSH